uniref:Uncharacterized protein n=1 Tax=Phlebotomus papatasi TaxID=29031 RepID=A0A1B0DPE9_PHLPP
MGCLGSKDRLTKEDMEFLKSHTRYDEATIKEWYKGFKKGLANIKSVCSVQVRVRESEASRMKIVVSMTSNYVTGTCLLGPKHDRGCYPRKPRGWDRENV